MLKALELRQFAIVEELRLELSPGLNILTGETGAGKSILIDALSLLTGERAESSWIRSGSDSALIQGLFTGDHKVESAARRLVASGRSSARLNGELVTVGELSEQLGRLIAIHGQHASQLLSSNQEQRRLLDLQLPKEAKILLSQYQESYASYQQVTEALQTRKEATRERARRIDILSFQLAEINNAKLTPGELDALECELVTLRHAERIVQGGAAAVENLSEADINAVSLIAAAVRELESAGRYSGELASLAGELRDALMSVEATLQELEGFLADFEAQPGRLEALEARQALIEGLERKYGDGIESILRYRDEAQAELDSLTSAEADIEALEAEQQRLLGELKGIAAKLSRGRQQVAERLSAAVTSKLGPLGMKHAVFEISVKTTDKLTAHGQDEVMFLFSANLGEAPAPLSQVASGGELSRLMLALHVITVSDLPILAFDEVDAGVGGKTARAVGLLLKQLAHNHQVLVVTHLPQVAAFADSQFLVEKLEQRGRTLTQVRQLDTYERELELARMLSGTVTEASVANARELLYDAAKET